MFNVLHPIKYQMPMRVGDVHKCQIRTVASFCTKGAEVGEGGHLK